MRLSFDWLLDFVDAADLSPQVVADKLTMGAFEVEEIKKVGPDIKGPVVVGEIVEINPHPNADKIRLTKVKIDSDAAPAEIVCGAGNIIVGQRVPVALPGARVINRHDGTELHIKTTKIRGVQSNGMLCSPGELGIADGEPDGILILFGQPELGSDVVKLLHLYPDHILHVGTRSNRGDALCVAGIAREVAALCQRPLREPKWLLPKPDPTSDSIDINIENTDDCPYFSLRILQGVKVAPSPLRLRRRLEAVGVRPVNNVVDITNYVLHELGQPLHAYDLSRLQSRQMNVRRGKPGEILTTIDGREREVSAEALLIAEGSRPLGIAGVMGGKETEISDDTTFVALEAAAFHPARVRRASRLLGVSSESSLRFERGVDVSGVRKASDRAAALILESCGGFLGRLTEGGSDNVKPVTVGLRLAQLSRLAEIDIDEAQAEELLGRLGFGSKHSRQGELEVSVPSFRQADVTREIDLLEEICRLWGYDRVPVSMPGSTFAPERPDDTESRAREALSACGLSEAYTSSLVGLNPLSGSSQAGDNEKAVRVLNPLSEDHQIMRTSLGPGLIKAAAYNQDRGARDVYLFEIGRVYEKEGVASQKDAGVREELRAAGLLSGRQTLSAWREGAANSEPAGKEETPSNFYAAKGVIENLLEKLSIDRQKVCFASQGEKAPYLHPGRSCRIELEEEQGERVAVGWLGDIHPAVARSLGMRLPVSLFEISLARLRSSRKASSYREIFTTPNVVRDLTADVSEEIEHDSVYRSIMANAGPHLRSLELVSVFNLPGGSRSLSYRMTFQHPDETLTNDEVERQIASIRARLQGDLKATFRT